MNPNVGSIEYDARISTDKLKQDAARADRIAKNSGDSLGKNMEKGTGRATAALKRFAKIGLLGAATAITAFGVSSVRSFMESENAITQTNAVLKSTKGIAGVTAEAINELSDALQKTTKFSDEEVRSAQNLLLTFTAIGKDIFPEATKTVLDMSTALGQDLKSSSIQLGKALQDPILGVTALRRVGVNFSKDQVEVIKKLVETGQKAKAQKLILRELSTEFGGSAAAAATTYSGKIAILRNRFDELKESVGKTLIDAGFRLFTMFDTGKKRVQEFSWITGSTTTVVQAHTDAINRQKTAKQGIITTQSALNTSTGQVKLAQEAVKLAQDRLNASIDKYGANSRQAQSATDSLRGRQSDLYVQMGNNKRLTGELANKKGDLRRANERTKDATNDLKKAQRDFGKEISGVIKIVDSQGNKLLAQIKPIQLYIGELQRALDMGGLVLDQGTPSLLQGLNFEGRQHGGPVTAGRPYVVGENRKPELFIPNHSGRIIPNNKLSAGGGNVTIQLNMAGIMARSRSDLRDIAKDMTRALNEELKAKGLNPIGGGAI